MYRLKEDQLYKFISALSTLITLSMYTIFTTLQRYTDYSEDRMQFSSRYNIKPLNIQTEFSFVSL